MVKFYNATGFPVPEVDFKGICQVESFPHYSENGAWTKTCSLSLPSEVSQKRHKLKLKFLQFLQMKNQVRQRIIPWVLFLNAYIELQVSDKNRNVLICKTIYWFSLVLSSHFLFQLLWENGWSYSASSPRPLRGKHITYCFYLSFCFFSATCQSNMVINLEDNLCAYRKITSIFLFHALAGII